MTLVALGLLLIAAVTIGYLFLYVFLKAFESEKDSIVINEPDLKLVDKPELLNKIPENEEWIPDSNSPPEMQKQDKRAS